MKKNKKLLKSFSAKVTITVCIMMFVCSLIWTSAMLLNMRNNAIYHMVNEERADMEQAVQKINNIDEVCNMALHIISRMDSVKWYLEKVQAEQEVTTQEVLDFYNNDFVAIYNIMNLNPYLNQIRLFVNAEHMKEQAPSLYSMDSMKNLAWAQGRVDGKWNMDYSDDVSPEWKGNQHLASVTTAVYNSAGEELYVVEVATEMSLLFPKMYLNNGEEYTLFLENSGGIHYNEEETITALELEKIRTYVKESGSESQVSTAKIGGKNVVLSTAYIEALEGYYVHIRNIDTSIQIYYNSQKAYFLVVMCSLLVCIISVALITKSIFRRFYLITDGISKIEHGQTDLRLEIKGDDEIADMAKQVNLMLDGLKKLNEENTTRQLMVKNTEIKAMQNQINAHFMYNVLESIKMMAEIEEQYEISDAITSLGQMFRYSVKWTSGKVELKDEIEYIRNYLALMNLRFDYQIILAVSVPEKLMNHRIPKMALQPIVENSVLHGIEGIDMDTSIYLKVFVEQDVLHMEVSDNGKGMNGQELGKLREKLKGEIKLDEEKVHGLALKNVQDRIKMYYGESYGLEVYSKEGVYTKVVVLIPYEKGEN